MNYAKRILPVLLIFCVLLNLSTAVFAGDSDELPPSETTAEETTPEESAPTDEEASSAETLPDEDATLPETTAPPEGEEAENPPEPEVGGEDPASESSEVVTDPVPSEELPTEDTEADPEAEAPIEEATDDAPPEKEQIEAVSDDETEAQEAMSLKTSGFVTGDKVPIYLDFCILFKLYERDAKGFPWMSTQYVSVAEGGNTLVTSGDWIYCIDYYNHAQEGYVSSTATDLLMTPLWTNLSKTAQRGITHALIYGGKNYGTGDIYAYAATQLIVWEYQLGKRTNPTQNVSFFSATLNGSTRLRENYNAILAIMAKHYLPPSFNVTSVTLQGRGKANGVTLTDTSGQLANDTWSITSDSNGIAVKQNGNDLLVYATDSCPDNAYVTITLHRNLKVATGNAVGAISGEQRVIVGIPPDPVSAAINVKLQASGSLAGRKTSPNGDVEGYCFKFYSWAADRSWFAKTDANGNLCLSDSNYSTLGTTQITGLPDGQYSMLEVLSRKGKDLVYPDSWTITVSDADGKVTSITTFTSESMTVTTYDANGNPKITTDTSKHMTTDANGDCRIQDAIITGLSGGGTVTMTINNVPNTLEIYKTSPDGKIEGITFHVYDANNTEVGSDTTDANGKIEIEGLVAGQTYTVHEDVPQGYICTENDKTITIQTGRNEISFENKPLVLKLIKESPDGNTKNVTFQIFAGYDNYMNGTVWQTLSTGLDGSFTITGIPAGDYWFREVPLTGYAVQPDQKVTVTEANTENNPAVVTFVNEPLVLKLVKESADGNNSNISFRIYAGDTSHANGKVWKIVKTDANGTWTITGIPAGVYWIREVVPDGYTKQADQRIEVTTANTEDNPAVVTFVNKPITLKIIKQSPDGNNEGITFQIFKSDQDHINNNVWQTVVTGEGGSITLEKLTPGTYWVREIVPEGYASQEDQRVTVTTDNTPENPAVVTFVNVPLSALKVVKTSPDGNVEGITFQLFEGDFGHNTETVFAEGKTDADGVILFTGLDTNDMLSRGVYWVREIVPEGYAPQEDQRIVVTTANTPVNPAVVTFNNIPLYGSISVNKVNTADTPLSGATFLLEYSTDDGATWTAVKPATEEENGIGTCSTVGEDGTVTTGEDGQAKFENLIIYGVTYRLTETVAPAGYQLLAEPVFVGEITANEEDVFEIYLTVVNAPLLQMPPTGGDGSVRIIGMVSTLVAAASICILTLLLRKRKENG